MFIRNIYNIFSCLILNILDYFSYYYLKNENKDNIEMSKHELISDIKNNLDFVLSFDLPILKKQKKIWLQPIYFVSRPVKHEITRMILDIYHLDNYWIGNELVINLFSEEELLQIEKEEIRPVFPDTFRHIKEDEDEQYNPPPKKEDKGTWKRTNEKKDNSGWTTVKRR